jgi:hypothetical protein
MRGQKLQKFFDETRGQKMAIDNARAGDQRNVTLLHDDSGMASTSP